MGKKKLNLWFQVRKKPDDLKFDCIVVDVEFHPKKDVIASGTIDGDIFLYVTLCSCHVCAFLPLESNKQSIRRKVGLVLFAILLLSPPFPKELARMASTQESFLQALLFRDGEQSRIDDFDAS